MRPNALLSRRTEHCALAFSTALILALSVAGCDFSGLDWSGVEAPCRPGACDEPSPPAAASAWEGDWTGIASVTYYGDDGTPDSTRDREVDLQVEFNPFEVEQIRFERARRPSRYVGEPWDHLSEDSLHVVAASDTSETTFAFEADENGATGRVAVRDSSSGAVAQQVWDLDVYRPEN